MRPPKLIKPYVVSFCRSIVSNPHPVYVQVDPLAGEPENECFFILPRHVSQHGGEQVIGWAIWEWPRVFIEAEFHAIWRQPDGELLDPTPKNTPIPRILFLPDPHRVYTGRQVDNIRKPLDRDPAIKRFCDLSSAMHHEQNRGALADYHGPIVLTETMQRIDHERQILGMLLERRYGRNTPEPLTRLES